MLLKTLSLLLFITQLSIAFSFTHTNIINDSIRRYHDIPTRIAMSSSRGADADGPLCGKTALVTGSSGGIGKAIAKKFAEAGADVIVHYNTRRNGAISTYTEINEQNPGTGKCLGIIQADFCHPKQIDEMFQCITNEILKDDKRLDILVNNAGVVTKLAVEDDDNLSSWHETMAVNLNAPLQLMKLSHAHMKATSTAKQKGVIINNTSIHGSRSVEYMTAYAASKAALDSLTRGLACEYAAEGIRVNAIAPGVVPVERTEQIFAKQSNVDMWTPHLPLGRLGTVQDIADATLQLATNEWMSGTVLTVDGGMMSRANMPIRPRPPKPAAKEEEEAEEKVELKVSEKETIIEEATPGSRILFEVP